MFYKIFFLFFTILLIGCTAETTNKQHFDADKLMQQKCSSCHNLDLPPKTFADEKAPPMMAVAFHIRGFIQANSESDKVPNAIAFVKDYVLNPSAEKSFCDKKSLQDYGVMPSQKGKVTDDELEAIATYMFAHFTQKNLNEAQAVQNRLNALPKGERLALQNGCLSCHKNKRDLVGPSFEHIAKRYNNKTDNIINSIKNGSKDKWKNLHGALMPPFKNKLTDKQIITLANWICHEQ